MASTYLSRTASSGSQKTFTISFWVKRSSIGSSYNYFFSSYQDANNRVSMTFLDTDYFIMVGLSGGSAQFNLTSNRVFRDVNAWYHIVISVDTTQSTASDRIKLYVNGVQETSFSTETYPSQNADLITNTNHYIGTYDTSTNYLDGSLAHYHYIDGTAYDASAFGETDATTGIWKPKTNPSVTYGTNGFFLKFENSGSMGTDSSGNGNNFTVNGTMTQTVDTPSNVFATYNSLIATKGQTFSNGNLSVATTTTNKVGAFSTLGVSKGKYYAEFKVISGTPERAVVGITDNPAEEDRNDYIIGTTATSYCYYGETGYKVNNSSGTPYGDTYTVGDIVSVALDLDNNYLYFAKNGTWQNSGDPTSGASGTGAAYNITAASSTGTGFYFIGVGDDSGAYAHTIAANFGNGYFQTTAVSSAQNPDDGIGIFEHSVPTGYKALCTKSINAEEYA